MPSWQDLQVHFHYRVASLFLRLRRDEWAAAAYERALRVRPDDRQAEFHRAWCLLHVPRRRQEGITAFQDLLRVEPSASGFFLLGCGLQHELRHEEAVQAFREAARLEDPAVADFHYNYGVSLIAVEQFEQAAEAYGHATQISPSDADAWDALGTAFAELGRWRDALPCHERAMRLAPRFSHGFNLASTLYELNRLEEAEHALLAALVYDPKSVEAKELLAQVLADQGRHEEAITLARELCESKHVILAGVLAEAGHLDEALIEAKTAVEAAPTDARAHGVLGAVYMKMNEGAAALAAFERMSACLDPSTERRQSSGWLFYAAGRGSALSLLGRHQEAILIFQELLRIDRGFLERWLEFAPHYERSMRETTRSE